MDKFSHYLHVLGLKPGATLEDAKAAYKDLIRVWHPDRFESDPRLRRKAEEETRRLNEAIAFLRQARFEPPSSQPHRATPQHSAPSQRSTEPPPTAQARPNKPRETTRTVIFPTLNIYQTKRGSLAQLITGTLLLLVALFILDQLGGDSPIQAAFAIVLASHGGAQAITGVTLLCLKKPVISINSFRLSLLGAPPIPICELNKSHIWTTRRGTFLTVTASHRFVKQLPWSRGWLMRLRHSLLRIHLRLRCDLLDQHPAAVINAIKLITQNGESPNLAIPKIPTWVAFLPVVGYTAVGAAILRGALMDTISVTTVLPYLAIFVTTRLLIILQPIDSRKKT